MRWNTSSFYGVELSELQGIEVKQSEREKRPDTGGTQTLRLQVEDSNPAREREKSLDTGRTRTLRLQIEDSNPATPGRESES